MPRVLSDIDRWFCDWCFMATQTTGKWSLKKIDWIIGPWQILKSNTRGNCWKECGSFVIKLEILENFLKGSKILKIPSSYRFKFCHFFFFQCFLLQNCSHIPESHKSTSKLSYFALWIATCESTNGRREWKRQHAKTRHSTIEMKNVFPTNSHIYARFT